MNLKGSSIPFAVDPSECFVSSEYHNHHSVGEDRNTSGSPSHQKKIKRANMLASPLPRVYVLEHAKRHRDY